jgi:TRAP-type mannitol/chloroaromatic compound transport system substrate-binding protein
MSKYTVTFEFKSQDTADEFSAWFLDGGGMDAFGEFCEEFGISGEVVNVSDSTGWKWIHDESNESPDRSID